LYGHLGDLGAQPMLVGLYSDHLHLDLKKNGWLLLDDLR
jgi:hypothetical protein